MYNFKKVINLYPVNLVGLYKDATNRMTDNIWLMHGFFIRQFQVNRMELNNQFGIDEDELDELV